MKRIIIIATCAVLLSGCAIHNPMSEMLMFKTKKDFIDGREYSAKYSHAFISYTADLYNPEVVVDYANSKGSNESYTYNTAKAITTHSIFYQIKWIILPFL